MKQQADYKKMTDSELTTKIVELKSNLFNLRFSHKAGQLTKTSELSNCRKEIAKVLTEIKARNIDTTGLKVIKIKKEARKEVKKEKTDKVAEVKKAAEKVAAKKAEPKKEVKTETKAAAKPETKKAAAKPATATVKPAAPKAAAAKTTTKKEAK